MTAATTAGPGALVRAAAAGDSDAWDALVGRYTGLMWSVARGFRLDSADAADAVQTSWLRLLEHLDRLRDPDAVGAWLATTVRHECLGALRRAGREHPTPMDEIDLVDDRGPMEADLLREESDTQLWRAVDRLPDRCRGLLRVLMTDPPPSYGEVAAALDMPIGSIGPTRARCLERLRRELEQEGAR